MSQVMLPRLVGSRESADQLLGSLPRGTPYARLVLNCRELLAASPSFADEVVKLVLVEGRASELVVLGASDEFAEYIKQSAEARDVFSQVAIRVAGSEVGA
jgi:hypothetical protein